METDRSTARPSKLRREDYRAPDPAALFPAHASGTLPGLPIDTPAFTALEELVQATMMREIHAQAEREECEAELQALKARMKGFVGDEAS